MKQRITIEYLEQLNEAQQNNLRDIWVPERYDAAVAKMITNAEDGSFKWIEFSVGDVVVQSNGRTVLHDLRLTDGYVKIIEGELPEEEFQLQEPTSFSKLESLPLLSIGQLISMLHLMDKNKYHFYLLSGNKDFACEIGDFNSELKASILSKSTIKDELVDVLWSTLKTIL